MTTKQVIVMRKFDSMRTGKYCAQAAHASVSAFIAAMEDESVDSVIDEWIDSGMKKITVYVNEEKDLHELWRKTKQLSIPCALIKDAGHTEFHGVPTITALGIGPWTSEEIDKVTGHLPLF
jgi:peptidyl-tRNA hydrolase, PTH2 family